MIETGQVPDKHIEEDEGELDSEDDTKSNSSEGYTSDGGSDSKSSDRSDSSLPPVDETPWERGLRLARERARKAKLLRQTDVDVEDKKLNLTVVAPDLAEDGAFADICDMGRSNPSDTIWMNYHKLSIIGGTQLTCKRALPCDLEPPSHDTIMRWRKFVQKSRHRSSSASSRSSSLSGKSSASSASSNFGSRSSSLSSLAGSIYQAVPVSILAGDSDAENGRRRRRKRGSVSGSSSSSSSMSRSRSSSPKAAAAVEKTVKRTRGSISASSMSRSPSQSPRNRGTGRRGSFTRGRRGGGIGSYGEQPQPRQPQPISGYHYQQSNFNRGGSFRDGDSAPGYGERRPYGDSARWREPSDRSPERPPQMPSERPNKRPWAAEPPRQRGPDRQRSPLRQGPPPLQHQRSRRSRSRSMEEPPEGRSYAANTSWSQSRSRQPVPLSNQPPPVSSHIDRSPIRTSRSPPRKRAAGGQTTRRKSRSPFADTYFGNPPPPSSSHAPQSAVDDDLVSPIPFEQTAPLLAGVVNPAAPSSSRPGVKLTIAPRIRVGGSALVEQPPPQPVAPASSAYPRIGEGSPVSSTSSSPAADTRRNNSPRGGRQVVSGYTAVSPGGFDSPPSRSQHQQRPVSRTRGFDQNDDQTRMRGRGGDYGRDRDDRRGRDDFRNDRFSRGGGGQGDRYRDRRPPPPSSNDRFDRRSGPMNDRNPQPSYDRGRGYGGEPHYGRPRGGRMDNDRGYDRGRHDVDRHRRDVDRRGGGDRDRSRSPFEDRRRRDRDNNSAATLSSKEARLDELRKRLAVLDNKITELGGSR